MCVGGWGVHACVCVWWGGGGQCVCMYGSVDACVAVNQNQL